MIAFILAGALAYHLGLGWWSLAAAGIALCCSSPTPGSVADAVISKLARA